MAINLYLTNYCNLECAHCMHSSNKDNKLTHLVDNEIDYIFQFLNKLIERKTEIGVIGLTGGEPMCHPNFYDILYFLKCLIKENQNRINLPIELHTNGTIEFKEIEEFYKFFYRIYIGHDIFHDKFRRINETYIDNLSNVGQQIIIKKPTFFDVMNKEEYIFVRNKGRAKSYFDSSEFKRENECVFNKASVVPLNGLGNICFAHDHIRFCSENSEDFENKKCFTKYYKSYLKTPEKLVEKSLKYLLLHSRENCKSKCTGLIFKTQGPVAQLVRASDS